LAESKFGDMIHARLIPGADTSGKLVSEVKKKASEIAKKKSKEWILIDVSPAGLVINKYDLNEKISEKIKSYCQEEEIELLTKIPYSRIIVESLKKGELFVDNDQDLRERMLKVKSHLIKKLEVE